MTLRDEIISKCSPDLLALHDTNAIANVINSGRVKPNKVEIGNGTILEVLGLSVGNALLDIIYTDSNFRHVKHLVEQGRLTIDSPLILHWFRGRSNPWSVPFLPKNRQIPYVPWEWIQIRLMNWKFVKSAGQIMETGYYDHNDTR